MLDTASPQRGISMFKPVVVAEALAALIRPRVLFCGDAGERQAMAGLCLQAWNIGCMSTPDERDAAVAGRAECGLPRGTRSSANHTELLRMLVAQRVNEFPYLHTVVDGMQVLPGSDTDDLTIARGDVRELLRVQWRPTEDQIRLTLSAVTALGPLLASLPADLRSWLARNVAAPDVWATRASNRCRLLLLELNTCRSMVAALRAHRADAGRFKTELEEVDRVEGHTLAFLASLCIA